MQLGPITSRTLMPLRVPCLAGSFAASISGLWIVRRVLVEMSLFVNIVRGITNFVSRLCT